MSGVDRAALIEAAAKTVARIYNVDGAVDDDVRIVCSLTVDAVLPLVAQAIEAQAPYGCALRPDGREDPGIAAWAHGIGGTAALVRSLAEEGQQQ